MTRRITDGAEMSDSLFWDGGSTPLPSSQTNNARMNNGRSWMFAGQYGYKNIIATTEFYAHFSYLTSNVGSAFQFQWRTGTIVLGMLNVNPLGKIDLYTGSGTLVGSGTTVLQANRQYVIEPHVKISKNSGVLELKIDGVIESAASFTGKTQPGTQTTLDNVCFNCGYNIYIDDIALNDISGTVDNSWCGDFHIYPMYTDGNGDSSLFLGSDGNRVDNYLLVGDIPSDGDTSYVYSSTRGDKDLYTLTDLPSLPVGSTIRAVTVETRARELTADGDAIRLMVKSGTTEANSANIILGTSYGIQKAEFLTNPSTSAAWTVSDVNNMQAGFNIP